MNQIYLGIDCGTTSIKCMAINEKGKKLYIASRMHVTNSPKEGWMEQEPAGWVQPMFETVRECVSAVGKERIKALALSGHMSSPVFLDDKNQPLYPCMTVGDARCEKQAESLIKGYEDKFKTRTNNKPLACFVAPKILWFIQNEPEKYKQTKTVVMAKDYLRYVLTGILNTDTTDAGNTLLFDEKSGTWDEDFITELGIRSDIFPKIVQATDYVGSVLPDIAKECNLPSEVSVYCGGADMACSQIGTGSFKEGILAITLSTSGQACMNISDHMDVGYGKVTFHPSVVKGKRYAMGSVFSGGLALNWCYRMLSGKEKLSKEDLNKMSLLAGKSISEKPGSDGVVFLPFLTGSGSPYFCPTDRASLVGMSTTTNDKSVFQAVMEGVSYNIKESVELMSEMAGEITTIYLSGGGTHVKAWIRVLTDIIGKKIHILEESDASTLGAALIAAAGDRQELNFEKISAEAMRVVETVVPDMNRTEKYKYLYSVYKEYYQMLQVMYQKIEDFVKEGGKCE